MHIDMHYYGTYALARAAGISRESAEIIAMSSQFVDDSIKSCVYSCADGSCILAEATGHHFADIANLNAIDQRNVWIPFHFLPGNSGSDFFERLRCVEGTRSPIARDMIDAALLLSKEPFAREMIGIIAHVYADTFAHYGFSGVSSSLNRVDQASIELDVHNPDIETYIRRKAERFFRKHAITGVKYKFLSLKSKVRKLLESVQMSRLVGEAAELVSGALGHGGVATHPDRPYLHWGFRYEQEKLHSRSNEVQYLQACEGLFNIFSAFLKTAPDEWHDADSARPYAAIEKELARILSIEADEQDRIKEWQEAVRGRKLYNASENGIPAYKKDKWAAVLQNFKTIKSSSEAAKESVYRFYQAASHYRHTMLRDILPSHGLMVV